MITIILIIITMIIIIIIFITDLLIFDQSLMIVYMQDTANNGILGFGSQYNDACGENNDCMTLLSLQVAMLMIMKPLPKLFTDVILP